MTGIVGILLAAGRGERFGGDKLRASGTTDPMGESVGVVARRNLLAAIPDVVAAWRDVMVRIDVDDPGVSRAVDASQDLA